MKDAWKRYVFYLTIDEAQVHVLENILNRFIEPLFWSTSQRTHF